MLGCSYLYLDMVPQVMKILLGATVAYMWIAVLYTAILELAKI
jgi:hypothetical protein